MNGLPFQNLPASRPDPQALVQQQFTQAIEQLDVQWENKYRDLNRKYDWSRQKRDPDEIGRIREALKSQIENQKRQLQAQYKQQTDQFNLIDQTLGPEQAEQAKWRLVAGPDVAGRMFPKARDWRLEHQRAILERGRLMSLRDSYKLNFKGRLYGVDDVGKIDKDLPATEAETQGWIQSIKALESLHIYEREQILPNLTTADIASTRLQELMLERREKDWRKEFEKTMWKVMKWIPGPVSLIARGRELFTPETPGTFANKVSATMTQPIAEPRVREPRRKKLTKEIALKYLNQYGGNREDAMAAAELAGYVE